MKINGRCRACNRDFPLDVLLTSGAAGHCPFCGVALDAHYAAMLANAVDSLQRAGAEFERALEQLTHYGPNLELDATTILEPIQAVLTKRAARAKA